MLVLQKFLITITLVSQNIICSAAKLSHTYSISAPDGWVHNKFSSSSLAWKSHIRIDFLKVFVLRGTSSEWVSSYLPAGTELLKFTSCSSPPYPCKTPACFPPQALSYKPAFCWLFPFIWPFQRQFTFPKKVCLYLHPGLFPTFIF